MSNTNPNDVDARTNDAKSAMAECPLMKEKVQLLPLRYGLVERLDPSSAIKPPYTLKSRPLGVRLIRDGWLYIIDNSTGYLHEYSVKGGAITKRLWQGTEASQDQREGGEGDSILLFPRLSRLHVAYSEVQWTAKKCSQMIGSVEEREHFMQVVNLSSADPIAGATHLLTERQAKQWIAEVAEPASTEPLPEGANVDEGQDYVWENQTLFQKAQMGTVKNQLQGAYQTDHLYLVFEDNIGVLRDLAQEQDTVVGWIDDWRGTDDTELKYMVGRYIETLAVLSDQNVQSSGASDNFQKKTTPQQRQSVYDYVNAKNARKSQSGEISEARYAPRFSGGGTGGSPKMQALQADVDNKKQAMQAALGDSLYDDLEDDIDAMQDSTHATLEGKGLGARGINDLVRYEEMIEYVEAGRLKLSRWTERLDRITADRTMLFTKGEFHRSAWYFDPDHSDQLLAALSTELNCVRDMCRTEESQQRVGDYFNENPQFILPTFHNGITLSDLTYKAVRLKKILDGFNGMWAGIDSATERLRNVETVLANHWTRTLNLSGQAQNISQLINASYVPSIALGLTNWLADAQAKINTPQLHEHLKKLESYTNRAQRLGTLAAIRQDNLTVKIASESDVLLFNSNISRLVALLAEEDALMRQSSQAIARSRRRQYSDSQRLAAQYELQEHEQALIKNRAERDALTQKINSSVDLEHSVGAGAAALKLNLTAAQQGYLSSERDKLKLGAKGGYGEGGAAKTIFKSSWISLAALTFQCANIGAAWDAWWGLYKEGKTTLRQDVIFTGAIVSPISSLLSVIQTGQLGLLDKAFKSVLVASDGKAGQLFAVKIGKVGLGFGSVISPLAFVSAVSYLWGRWSKWTNAALMGTVGEQIGAYMGIAGDTANTVVSGVNTWAAFNGLVGVVRDVKNAEPGISRAAAFSRAWATRGAHFLEVSAWTNPFGLAALALQLGGEVIYNYSHLNEQQQWFLHSCWGLENQKWDWPTHAQKLAEVKLRPVITDKGFSSDLADDSKRTLSLTLPGISESSLQDTPIYLTAGWQQDLGSHIDDIGLDVSNSLRMVSDNPLVLNLDVPFHMCLQHSSLKLRLSVQPHLASKPLNGDDLYLYYNVPLDTQLGPPVTGLPAVEEVSSLKTFKLQRDKIRG